MIAVFLGDLIVETVDVGDVAGLVVSSEEHDHLGVFYFVEEEQKNGLDWVVAPVDIVSQEDVAFFGDHTALAEELQ